MHRHVSTIATAPHSITAKCLCGKKSTDTTAAKARAKLDLHITKKNHERCPQPDKVRYDTDSAAQTGMFKAWRRPRTGPMPVRTYLCRCGSWHLTCKPYRGGTRKPVAES